MKSERSKVEFPVWRKKVDSSLFQHQGTVIPKWVCGIWSMENIFPGKGGKRKPESEVSIKFGNSNFIGWITSTWPKKRATKVYRLWFDDDLNTKLKEEYLMSFMRDIEGRLREKGNKKQTLKMKYHFGSFLILNLIQTKKDFYLPLTINKSQSLQNYSND